MSNRQDFIDDILDRFRTYLKAGDIYSVEPVNVFEGLPDQSKIVQFPALCIQLVNDAIEADTSGGDETIYRRALFIIAGYTNNKDECFNLCEDVEHFLYKDVNFPYNVRLDPEGATFTYNGITKTTNLYMFDFQFIVLHNMEV